MQYHIDTELEEDELANNFKQIPTCNCESIVLGQLQNVPVVGTYPTYLLKIVL